MTLMDKFDAVEVITDNRITEADRQFFQKHQDAYQSAVEAFQQMKALVRDLTVRQKELLGDSDCSSNSWKQYLTSWKFPELEEHKIALHIDSLHSKFIAAVVKHLNAAYHLSVDADSVERDLLPRSSEDDLEEQDTADTSPVILRYEDIIDLILSWFGGRALSEQAPYELVENCHRAAWSKKDHTQKFQQKKNVVTFSGGACSYGYSYTKGYESWTLENGIRDVLKGLAHFETGRFDEYPDDLDYFIQEDAIIRYDLWEFDNCQKLERIKLFKNGRMDIRFANEGYARQFVTDYLGTVW